MPEWTGTVVASSDFGIKVVDGGGWLNWSLPEYRGTPFDSAVRKGDKVRIEYAEVEKDGKKKTYISVIENLSHDLGGGVQEGTRKMQQAARETNAVDQPFPPEQDFPLESDAPFPSAATEPPPDAFSAPPEALDRQTSIVRQTCIKAASVALQHSADNERQKAGAITYLAGVMEDWVWR